MTSDFEKKYHVKYLSTLRFENRRVEEKVRRLCRRVNPTRRAKWLGVYLEKELENHRIAPLSIRKVDETIGYGLFAEEFLPEGTWVGEYTGIVRACTIFRPKTNEYTFRYPLYRTFWTVFSIDAKEYGNETRFLNHSEKPNCEAVALFKNGLYHLGIRTLKEVERDEELVFDYHKEIWTQS